VLVMGASGKTGRAVTAALVARGLRVRAGVRSDAGARAAYAAGAREMAHVDLVSGVGLAEAAAGCRAIYHLAPNVHPDEVGMATRAVAAARAGGVRRIVFHSVLHPDDHTMPHHLRKAAAEEVVRRSGLAWTMLRPAAYHQNLAEAARGGRLAVPYRLDAPFTNVDLRDVAEVAALVLGSDGAGDHEGQTYDLCGAETLTVSRMAHIASSVLGREVAAARVDPAAWARAQEGRLAPGAIDDLLAMFAAYDRRGFVGSAAALRILLRRAPATWADVLRREALPSPVPDEQSG
jgi:uncharacterized protein YbjT (DUF2867 family)